MTLGGANVWTNFSYGYRNESPSGWLLSPDRSRLILFTRNKKSPRNSMRIFAHTYYANDLGVSQWQLNPQLKCIWIMLGINGMTFN